MFKFTLKSIRGHKARLVSTGLAIILGVGFLAGTLVLTDSVQASFDDLFGSINEGVDAEVRSSSVQETSFGDFRPRIPAETLNRVRAIEGVADVQGVMQGTGVVIVGPDGETVGGSAQGPPSFGFNWFESPTISPATLDEGSAPTDDDEVVIDKQSALTGDISVGDTIGILSSAAPEDFEVSGIATFGRANSPGGASVALFTLNTAERLLDSKDKFDVVDVTAEPGISQDEIAEILTVELDDPDLDVITGEALTEENSNELKKVFGFFSIFLTVFALIALFVGSFVIYNTFAIIVAQRTKELALLRALGASRRQILGSVLGEGVVVGIVASGLGTLVGLLLAAGLKAGLSAGGISLPPGGVVLLPRTVIVGLVAGVSVTLFAAFAPALKASRISPLEAMRAAAVDNQGRSRGRLISGSVVLTLGVGLLLYGLLSPEISLVGVGAAFFFTGLLMLGPVISPPVTHLLSKPLTRFKGVTGRLAGDNATRNPTRTARTAAALLVGVALVSAVTVLASSLKSSVREIVEKGFVGDYAVESGSFGEGGLSPQLAKDLSELPEVEVASGVRFATMTVEGDSEFLSVVDPQSAVELFDIGLPDDFNADDFGVNDILLFEGRADDLGLSVGDTVEGSFSDGVVRDLTISSLYDDNALTGNYTISTKLWEESGEQQFDVQVYVKLADGVDVEGARPKLEALTDEYANAELQSKPEFIEAQTAQLDTLVNMIYGLLMLAVIIAVFGIANTLRLSIYERTQEIGLLRAVGMRRSQVRSIIRWEAVLTSVLGAFQGIIVGLALGYVVIYALRDEGIREFSVPSGSLIIILVLAGLLGVVAAIRPARKAAKMNVLDAISHE